LTGCQLLYLLGFLCGFARWVALCFVHIARLELGFGIDEFNCKIKNRPLRKSDFSRLIRFACSFN